MKYYYLKTLIASMLLMLSALSYAELSATVDRTQIQANESLQLVVRYSGQTVVGEPDFSSIERDFEILSNSRQQQYSWVNGSSESFTDWKMLLLPKRSGPLVIPALSFKGALSKPVEVMVQPANTGANSGTGAPQPVYTETEIDKQSAYIQEQIILTLRLLTSVQLQDFTLSELELPDALVQRIGETQFQKVINGKNHLVLEIKYALFPQAVGKLEIPALRIGAYEARGFGQFGGFATRGNRILRLSEAQTVDILPIPSHLSADQWMPSSQLRISESWSDKSTTLKVGTPITRAITISAEGLTAAQIQPLPGMQNPDFKIYPDQPNLEDQTNSQGVLGLRRETLAIVPTQEGQLTMPPIDIQWWDTLNNRMQTTSLGSRTFTVIPDDSIEDNLSAGPPVPLVNNASSSTEINDQIGPQALSQLTRWSMALNALLITLVVALLYYRRTPRGVGKPAPAELSSSASAGLAQKLKLIEKHAAANNLAAMRDSILKWGTEFFPEQTPTTLKELGLLMDSDRLIEQFALLDRHLFKPNTDIAQFDAEVIISNLRGFKSSANNKKMDSGLKPLYPNT